jgi:FkbM family methyltransferase
MKLKRILKKAVKVFVPYGILVLYWHITSPKGKPKDDLSYKIDVFNKHFLKTGNNGESYYDVNGAKLPDIRSDTEKIRFFINGAFQDTFFVPYFLDDNHDKSLVEIFDLFMGEGPYGYKDQEIDVTVKTGDVVIDAGAWIGDFSAYAASKGASITYAFEPVNTTYKLLEKTAVLNDRKIYPVKQGLSNKISNASISIMETHSAANSLAFTHSNKSESISLTTLDEFVKENKIERIDFIKSDIEGEERNLLKGAYTVLKEFAPKLAICTYHFPEDAKLLESIILDINPKYKIVHLRHKLFAEVVK